MADNMLEVDGSMLWVWDKAAALSEVGVEAVACSITRDEAVACSKAKDGRQRRCGSV
jgi:hypothetical protein